MDKDILEAVLKRNSKETRLEKVVSIESLPAVGKNLNFLSEVNRLNLKVVLGNGRVVNKSYISKTANNSTELQDMFNKKYDTFRTEIMMYNTLSQIEYLMEEFEDTEDVLWCKMVHHIPNNFIVLEDLKPLGFHMIERLEFYDLEQILLVVHSLGRYHGIFKALERRGLAPQGFKPWFIFDNLKIQELMYWDIMALAEGVKKFWDPSWRPIVEKIKITKTQMQERLNKLKELDETKFNVTNHGDCHKNNIVIKYDWDKRPIAMRFLDFQIVHYGSPCIDLTYMLYLAVEPTIRRDNFDLILRTYHNSLINTLDKYHFDGNKPNLEEIKEGMEKYIFIGLILCLSWLPEVLTSEKTDELRDFGKIDATDGKEGYADEIFKPDVLEKFIGPELKAFVERFFSDS